MGPCTRSAGPLSYRVRFVKQERLHYWETQQNCWAGSRKLLAFPAPGTLFGRRCGAGGPVDGKVVPHFIRVVFPKKLGRFGPEAPQARRRLLDRPGADPIRNTAYVSPRTSRRR